MNGLTGTNKINASYGKFFVLSVEKAPQKAAEKALPKFFSSLHCFFFNFYKNCQFQETSTQNRQINHLFFTCNGTIIVLTVSTMIYVYKYICNQ